MNKFVDISKMYFWLIAICLGVTSCGVNKHIKEDQKLYGGAAIELEDETKFIHPAQLKRELLSTARPKENSKIKLWYHYNFGNPKKKKGLSNWVKRVIGEEPVFYARSDIDRSELYLEKYLFDRGYFSSDVTYDTVVHKKEVMVEYLARSEGRYRIRDVHWPLDSIGVIGLLSSKKPKSKIVSGQFYNVENLISERARLNNIARNSGYYLFDESDIFYFVDTAAKTETALQNDVWIKIKEPGDSLKHRQYFIGETHVYPNYDLSKASNIRLKDTVHYQDLIIYQNATTSTPKILRQSISQPMGAMYEVDKELITLNHLLELGIYKFVNQDYKIVSRRDTSFLDRYIYLTPALLQGYSGEVEMSSRASNFGLFLKGNYAHKNLFNGAERLDLSFGVGVQRGGNIEVAQEFFSNSLIELNGSAELTIPRFMVPFIKIKNTSSSYTPKTKIGLLATTQNRPDLFDLLNVKLSYGYDWRETKQKRHEFIPFNLNLVNFTNITDRFQNAIDLSGNDRLKQSITNLLIPSATYQFTYTNQELNTLKNYSFFRGKLETAGQFASVEFDWRYNIQKLKNQFVFRFTPAVAIPYSSSNVIPYTKQYFVGGPNSLRAFPNRGLLGSFDNGNDEVSITAFDQIGDIKVEMNAEYRFDLWKFLFMKGAFFVDAGNVWLLDKGTSSTEDLQKSFDIENFVNEMAVGAGIGIRFDVQFLVLRFDYAIPIRKPFLDKGERWTFSRPGFLEGDWLSKNGSFNIGIGYPF